VERARRALLIIDAQNDFMPFGALPVAEGDAVIEVANELAPRFDYVAASQDWHPAGHLSFASSHSGCVAGDMVDLVGAKQVLWVDHCIQDTPGASFHSGLEVSHIDAVVKKGTDHGIDSYSAFFDNNHARSTGLVDLLRKEGITEVYAVGLATDYCVLFTVLDARKLGFSVAVVSDGVRGVNLRAGDDLKALDQMRKAGSRIVTSEEV